MSSILHPPTLPQSAALRSFAAQWGTRAADPLLPLREQALQRFLKLGLPTTRDETWRHTSLRALAAQTFVDAPCKTRGEIEPNASLALLNKADRAASLLMVNGYPSMPPDGLINGVEVYSLRDVARLDPDTLLRFQEPLSDADQQRWALLNTALYVDGLYLKITSRLPMPLVILHVAAAEGAGNIAYPRIIIEATPGSSATIIEHHVAQGEHTPLSNSNTHIAMRHDSQVEHYRVFATGADATHMDSLTIRQDQGSQCKQFTIVLGGGLVRTTLEAHLDKPGASLDSCALLVGHQERHVDCVNLVTHAAPDTRSNQTARAIASDTSRVICNSKVIVNAGAMRAQSQQSCRGLLLSPAAEIDTRPQLEIHADEVKCAHGATTGRLDPNMLFYMLSRGLDRDTAQSLLVFAFLADALTGMSVASARAAIEIALIAQLPDSQRLRNFR
ncbi:MAG TPA: Fe-S cluster assembly protein SufD [Steroidobacteraceae bacterium]|jgi:Fe-S cluster assembly protein SufD|nr:Fe-S cluster assembly protein SufD [Steroidobacteraceae bacterium]